MSSEFSTFTPSSPTFDYSYQWSLLQYTLYITKRMFKFFIYSLLIYYTCFALGLDWIRVGRCVRLVWSSLGWGGMDWLRHVWSGLCRVGFACHGLPPYIVSQCRPILHPAPPSLLATASSDIDEGEGWADAESDGGRRTRDGDEGGGWDAESDGEREVKVEMKEGDKEMKGGGDEIKWWRKGTKDRNEEGRRNGDRDKVLKIQMKG